MTTQTIPGNVQIQGILQVAGGINRSELNRDLASPFQLPLTEFRVWDAFQTALGSAGTDDLGISAGAFGTGCPYITAGDLAGAGATTRYARAMFQIPYNYVAAETILLRLAAGMLTTVADTTATIDVEAYVVGRDGLKSGSDLVSTTAIDINSLSFTDRDFTLTATDLQPGDILDIRVAIAVNDGGTGTVVEAAIAAAEAVMTLRG